MARPIKPGIDYFPLDVDFLDDKKLQLLRYGSKYGVMSVLVWIEAACRAYRDNGYYTTFDKDDRVLMAAKIGCGCTAEMVSEIIDECAVRGLFDERVYRAYGYLTSAGIQRRYARAARVRDVIPIVKDIWLLDCDNENDVPASTRDKLAFIEGFHVENGGFHVENPLKRKRKEKEREKENCVRVSDESFDRFWAAYPRKAAKSKAREAFAKLNPDETLLCRMISAIDVFKRSAQWAEDDGKYIPHPTTWLNQRRWEDVDGDVGSPTTDDDRTRAAF